MRPLEKGDLYPPTGKRRQGTYTVKQTSTSRSSRVSADPLPSSATPLLPRGGGTEERPAVNSAEGRRKLASRGHGVDLPCSLGEQDELKGEGQGESFSGAGPPWRLSHVSLRKSAMCQALPRALTTLFRQH